MGEYLREAVFGNRGGQAREQRRRPIPQMVVRIDDRQVRLQDLFGRHAVLHEKPPTSSNILHDFYGWDGNICRMDFLYIAALGALLLLTLGLVAGCAAL